MEGIKNPPLRTTRDLGKGLRLCLLPAADESEAEEADGEGHGGGWLGDVGDAEVIHDEVIVDPRFSVLAVEHICNDGADLAWSGGAVRGAGSVAIHASGIDPVVIGAWIDAVGGAVRANIIVSGGGGVEEVF